MSGGARIAAEGPDKTQTEVPAATFVTFLPGDVQQLVDLARNEQMMRLIDSSPKTFATQLTLIAAVAKTYPQDPACRSLQKYVEEAMRSRYEQFENGTANSEVLDPGFTQYAGFVAVALYPAVPEQASLRDQLAQRKKWTSTARVAVAARFRPAANACGTRSLSAMAISSNMQRSFPDLAGLRTKALQASLRSTPAVGRAAADRARIWQRLSPIPFGEHAPAIRQIAATKSNFFLGQLFTGSIAG